VQVSGHQCRGINFRYLGLMTVSELDEYESTDCVYAKYWIPIRWAINLTYKAYQEKRIKDTFLCDVIVQVRQRYLANPICVKKICNFRSALGTVIDMDWIW
jgi:hypothetical protein